MLISVNLTERLRQCKRQNHSFMKVERGTISIHFVQNALRCVQERRMDVDDFLQRAGIPCTICMSPWRGSPQINLARFGWTSPSDWMTSFLAWTGTPCGPAATP